MFAWSTNEELGCFSQFFFFLFAIYIFIFLPALVVLPQEILQPENTSNKLSPTQGSFDSYTRDLVASGYREERTTRSSFNLRETHHHIGSFTVFRSSGSTFLEDQGIKKVYRLGIVMRQWRSDENSSSH